MKTGVVSLNRASYPGFRKAEKTLNPGLAGIILDFYWIEKNGAA